ncbi:CRISPR-associated helicase Cas3' [Methanothrix sp.]|uniref:CRISPR-associated helicase Cas3' n=1 Tax=Methanothrix sp. TaxID=90426 RepID=UPI003BB51174
MASMASESYSFKLKSHPDKRLVDHLRRVGQLSRKTVKDKSLNIDDKDLLTDAAYLIGVTHDLGKATKFFQEYIIETDEWKKRSLKAKDTTHHGLLSAFFAYAVIKEYLRQSEIKGGLADYLPIISFLTVKRHHGNLMNAMDEISEVDAEKDKILKVAREQIESMDKDKTELNEILELLLSEEKINLKIDIDKILDYILQDASREIGRKEKRLVRHLNEKSDLYPYFITQFLYSALLDADKTDAGLNGKDLDRLDLPADLVDQYRDRKGFTSDRNNINSLRNQIYEDAMVGISDWNLDNRILSLNVPTGTGKTLTSLSFALKLRDRLKKEKNFTPRIIYALPFLSIIDQNYAVFDDVVTQGGRLKDSRLLLKHHHLADVSYKTEDNDEYKADESLLLLEGWNAEIIVTTFWQYFYTLFSNKNKLLRKFNKLANSIIILDEVQAVPHQYWQLIHDATKMLCEKFNSYVVFVTATEPLIFDEAIGEIKEIVQKKEEYFRGLDRIELIPRIETALTLEEFKVLLEKDITGNPEKDFLIVLNTISAANDVYNFVKGLELVNTENFYLSTNVIPKERLERIRKIKEPSEKREANESLRKRKVIVSTQLIEAGVDIDADMVYRDFAPMDSINQVAGRCNRNSAKADKGTVSIFILKDDRKEFYKYIYDPFLMSKTLDTLKNINDPIKESDFLELNNKYFKAVKMGMGDEKSKENLACLAQLSFRDLSKKFKLIEEDYPKVNVFIELDETAVEIWKKYQDMRMEKDLKERIRKKLEIRKEFSEYVISAPEKFAHSLIIEDSEFGYISNAELPNYYDMETGFMRAGAGVGSMII